MFILRLDDATHRFQLLGRVCEVLTNDESRKLYDELGLVSDNSGISQENVDSWFVSGK